MRRALPVSLLALAGCSSMQQPGAHISKSLARTPYVEFVGDDLSIGMVAYANQMGNSFWHCTDCATGATSSQILEALPLALAQHPDVIHILVGTYDVTDPEWDNVCNADSTDQSRHTCGNIDAMTAQIAASGIPYVVGSVPLWIPGSLSNVLAAPAGGVDAVNGNIYGLERSLEYVNGINPGAAIADYYYVLMDPSLISGNGIDPTPEGYAAMIPLAQDAISLTGAGGTK